MAESGTTDNGYKYGGAYGYHSNTETHDFHVRARTYSPLVARWTSTDPFPPLRLFSNAYGFVGNNSLGFVDPSGYVRRVYMIDGNNADEHAWLAGRGSIPGYPGLLDGTDFYSLIAAIPETQIFYKQWQVPVPEFAENIAERARTAKTLSAGIEAGIGSVQVECGVTLPVVYDTIVFLGYSWGVPTAINVITRLKDENVLTDAVVTFDPIPRPLHFANPWSVSEVAGAFTKWHNYYQRQDELARWKNLRHPLLTYLQGRAGLKGRCLRDADISNTEITFPMFETTYPLSDYPELPLHAARVGHLTILRVLMKYYSETIVDFIASVPPYRFDYRIAETTD